MSVFLVDSSVWIAAERHPGTYLSRLLVERIGADDVATCVPVALEVLTGPPSGEALDRDWEAVWRHLRWLPVTERVVDRSLELLRGLAHTTAGAHRRRPIDYLIAACAESSGARLWHWDSDLSVICDYAEIAHESEHERAALNGLA